MKKIAAILFASLSIAYGAPAAAQQAAPQPQADAKTIAAVRDLMDAMHYNETTRAAFDQMAKSMPEMMHRQAEAAIKANPQLDDKQKAEKLASVEAELPKVSSALQTVFADPSLVADMEKEMVPLYARHFTVDELKQMAAFYRTPVGAKTLKVIPQIMQEAMSIGQRIAGPRIQKALQQLKNNK